MFQISDTINPLLRRLWRLLSTFAIALIVSQQSNTNTMAQQPTFEIPQQVRAMLALVELGESGGFTFSNTADPKESEQQRIAIFDWFRSSWPQLLKAYQSVVPSRKEQVVWIEVAEMLSPQDYMAYLNQMLDAYAAGSVPLDVVESALPGGRYAKQGFLAYNYDAPAVQSFYARAQRSLPATSSVQSSLSDGKAGKLKKEAIMSREMNRMPKHESLADAENATLRSADGSPILTPSQRQGSSNTGSETGQRETQPVSSTPWSLVLVMIAAAAGLLWLLVNKRK